LKFFLFKKSPFKETQRTLGRRRASASDELVQHGRRDEGPFLHDFYAFQIF
jgi:hypothetical protein